MLSLLRERLYEVCKAVAPLILLASVLQVSVVHAPMVLFVQFLAGSALVIIGMLLLFIGVDLGVLPMGRFIGAELPRKRSLGLIVGVGFAMGFATTVAEPDVLVLSAQVEAESQGDLPAQFLAHVIAIGVGFFAGLALLRVVYGFSLRSLLAITYSLILALTLLAPERFVALAYDAGSVTTGVLTTPVLLALAIGLSSVIAGRSAIGDGFGLLGLASAGPIIAVLLMGLWR